MKFLLLFYLFSHAEIKPSDKPKVDHKREPASIGGDAVIVNKGAFRLEAFGESRSLKRSDLFNKKQKIKEKKD